MKMALEKLSIVMSVKTVNLSQIIASFVSDLKFFFVIGNLKIKDLCSIHFHINEFLGRYLITEYRIQYNKDMLQYLFTQSSNSRSHKFKLIARENYSNLLYQGNDSHWFLSCK